LIRFDSKYCGQCGKSVDLKGEYLPAPPPPIESEKRESIPTGEISIMEEEIPDSSRLPGVDIEKFLGFDERIIFRTEGEVWFGDHKAHAYVTNNRILFYHREPKLMDSFQEDELDEIFPTSVKRISLVESGLIVKKMTLRMDEHEIAGDRNDLIGLYKAIQYVRAQA